MTAPSNVINPLTKKVQRVLDLNFRDDPELERSLEALSDFYFENSLDNRRFLRGNIENKSLELAKSYLEQLENVMEKIEKCDHNILNMVGSCMNIEEHLRKTKFQTEELLKVSEPLIEQKSLLKEKSAFLKAFMNNYFLKPEELDKLTKYDVFDEDFLRIYKKLQQLETIEKSKSNFKNEENLATYQFGLDDDFVQNIINENYFYKLQAKEHILKWIKGEFRSLGYEHSIVKDLLPEALNSIKFKKIDGNNFGPDNWMKEYIELMQELVDVRKSYLASAFLKALTQEGPSGMPKPIEIHAHDPLRYIGDILAWLHQFLMSERDLLSQIIVPSQKENMSKDVTSLIEKEIKMYLSQIIEGVGRPLKIRIEQIVVSENNEIVLYKLLNLLRYYTKHTLSAYLQDEPFYLNHDSNSSFGARDIRATLNDAIDLCRDKLLSTLAITAKKYSDYHKNYSRDDKRPFIGGLLDNSSKADIISTRRTALHGDQEEKPSNDLYPTASLLFALTNAKGFFDSFRTSFYNNNLPDTKRSSSSVEGLIEKFLSFEHHSDQTSNNNEMHTDPFFDDDVDNNSKEILKEFLQILDYVKIPIVQTVTYSSQLLLYHKDEANNPPLSPSNTDDPSFCYASLPTIKVNVYQLNCFHVIKREILPPNLQNALKLYENYSNSIITPIDTTNYSLSNNKDILKNIDINGLTWNDIYLVAFIRDIEKKLKIAQNLEFLAHSQADYVLAKSGLSLVQTSLFHNNGQIYTNTTLSSNSILPDSSNKQNLQESANNNSGNTNKEPEGSEKLLHLINASFMLFDQYLSAPDLFVMPEIPLLQNLNWRDQIIAQSQNYIVTGYTKLYDCLMGTNNGNISNNVQESGSNVMLDDIVRSITASGTNIKTPQQIRQLLN